MYSQSSVQCVLGLALDAGDPLWIEIFCSDRERDCQWWFALQSFQAGASGGRGLSRLDNTDKWSLRSQRDTRCEASL